ncbi:unnamed protein product [Acanthoscelides obtectus]|uniref:Uncharacterized protein n=1 Tax=Acanthoscelides obtectus TaxID=200917 RepID=A0A9P0M1D0_ACAOB|nr:unnamed protein product [Acanthoscelides obtectus]CAK1625125.1 hypothetical protein AOBTE_LOCUS2974 [Acanthoscelides obtectus]
MLKEGEPTLAHVLATKYWTINNNNLLFFFFFYTPTTTKA